MIAQMDQVTVVGRRGLVKDVLAALQNLGVVQVETLEPAETDGTLRRLKLEGAELAAKETWDRILARSTSLLDVLGLGRTSATGRSVNTESAAELEARLTEVADQVDRLVAERGELRDEYELTKTYLPLLRDLAPMLAQIEDSTYLAGVPFLAAENDVAAIETQLRTELDGGLVVATDVGEGEHRVDIAVADPRDRHRLLLAVDVDGPGYAGLASTRQRDRILVERLTDLGWAHLRLWAVDIFADPARQEAQVVRAVREAIAGEGT